MAEAANNRTTARIVWDTADKYLRNIVDEEDYGDYILPFTVLRRLECMLADTKEEVTAFVASLAGMPSHLIDIAVKDKFGLSFYNVSPLDLATIASVDDNVDKSLQSYIDGFSNNIADIWTSFEFNRRAKVLTDANRLLAGEALLETRPVTEGTGQHRDGRCVRGRHVPGVQQEGEGRR